MGLGDGQFNNDMLLEVYRFLCATVWSDFSLRNQSICNNDVLILIIENISYSIYELPAYV